MSDRALFPLRSCHGKKYNIFRLPDGSFEGRVFDHNRRVYCKTRPYSTVDKAIAAARADCELYAKGMCICGILVDEGKDIRDREEREYREIKKKIRNRTKPAGSIA